MPNVISFSQWKTATQRIPFFKMSAELKNLTAAFEKYNVNHSRSNTDQMGIAFKAWNDGVSPQIVSEKQTLLVIKNDLAFTIGGMNPTGQNLGSSVKPIGWELVQWTQAAYSWTHAVPPHQAEPALTGPQVQRINEAFRRAKGGVEMARDALITMNRTKRFADPVGGLEKFYVNYFGAYDAARFETVLTNFRALAVAFGNQPKVIDLRNTAYGMTCYAACYRKNLKTVSGQGSLALTGKVDMFLGRAFLQGGSYEGSTNATVGTLVHEFAHGAVDAVDAPRVTSDLNWELTPKQLGNPAHKDYGESPDNSKQSSTVHLDMRLAMKAPDIAIRNADSYGQFCADIVLHQNK